MPPTSGPTPEQLLQEADATAELARIVGYEKDKRALWAQAESLRERARALEASEALAYRPPEGNQQRGGVVSHLWQLRSGRAARRR